MCNQIKLRQVANGWEFESEKDLEDFIWNHLESLFGYKPLKRQYQVNGQYCDIIAIGQSQELVVLELKNSEDRYVVQQLTRYYDSLLEEQPFNELINYQSPVNLIAVVPHFHKDNYTDRKYHQLNFQFLSFQIIHQKHNYLLSLTDIDTHQKFCIGITSSLISESNQDIPVPPKRFLQLLERVTNQQKSKISQFREKVLGFDYRMVEIVKDGSIFYGAKSKKYCAELRLDSKKQLVLFLWLPRKFYLGEQENLFRFRIWTDWEKAAIVRPASRGLGKIHSVDIEFAENNAKNHHLNKFVDEALIRWVQRL
ncbi:MAG: endonuclease NucS [Nostocaceae cyanobacterium]|nr:endonuclease NucS [Nostocaceae cyanobacterium]